MEYKETGGARVGFMNATWPMVDLNVSKDSLTIDGKVVGRMVFKKSDVLAIEPVTALIGCGVRIVHKKRNINKTVIFWSLKRSGALLNKIREIVFLPGATELIDREKELILVRDKFPLRLKIVIPYLVILLTSLFIDFKLNPESTLHYSVIGSLISFLIINILIQVSKSFSRLILTEGKTKDDIGFISLLFIFVSIYNLFVYVIKDNFM